MSIDKAREFEVLFLVSNLAALQLLQALDLAAHLTL